MQTIPAELKNSNYNLTIRSLCTALANLHLMDQYKDKHTDAEYVELVYNTLQQYITELKG